MMMSQRLIAGVEGIFMGTKNPKQLHLHIRSFSEADFGEDTEGQRYSVPSDGKNKFFITPRSA